MSTNSKFITVLLIFISSPVHAGWFSDDVDLTKLPQLVSKSREFTASPAPKLKEVTFSDKVVTINAANSAAVEEKLSYIKSFGGSSKNMNDEDKPSPSKRLSKKAGDDHISPSNLAPFGTNLTTLGGLFSLGHVYTEIPSLSTKIKAESLGIKEFKNIDGSLFPLNVGNTLSFSYSMFNSSEKYGVSFEIRKKTVAQEFIKDHPEVKELNLIGDIYVIDREIKSTGESGNIEPCELYFSDEISYVIGGTCPDIGEWVKSYRLNRYGMSYREEVAALNKEKERQDVERKIHISEQLTPEQKEKARDKLSQAFNLFKDGEFEAAIFRFNQALEIDPANGLGHYYLAETYARLNNLGSAMEHYGYTVIFSPDIKEAAIAQVKQTKIRDALTKQPN